MSATSQTYTPTEADKEKKDEKSILESLPDEVRAAMEAMQRVARTRFSDRPFVLPRMKYAQL